MPNTILHFGINSDIAFFFRKYSDLPALILINVFINFESFLVILFNLKYPIHGYLHTFLIGSLVAIIGAVLLYSLRSHLKKIMSFLRLPYEPAFKKILISSLVGAWVHILLDAPLYADIKPLFPLKANPLYGLISEFKMNLICLALFIPAFILYIDFRRRYRPTTPKQ